MTEVEEDDACDDCCCCDKLNDLEDKIDDMIDTYTDDYKALMEEYDKGNVQQCVKVEAETVYQNLIKVLGNLKSFINE